MRKNILMGILLALFFATVAKAQYEVPTKAIISNVRFNVYTENVIIAFDILNARIIDRFDVNIKAFYNDGKELPMYSIYGDLKNVTPGENKTITWDIGMDLERLDDLIYFEVSAELLTPEIIKPVKKTKAYLYSTLFPGWGTYNLTANKYHLTKGVVSYGLIIASISSKLKSDKYYDDYLNSLDFKERNNLYEDADNRQKLAGAFAIGAVSIWLLEYVNIYFAENKVLNSNMELGVNIDKVSGLPVMSLNLKF
ncbi:MAG: hypothetical protein JEY96_17840 [Bacteroidales bacterium]|nr:hypothetical protein [Bacteroidales bacterium]